MATFRKSTTLWNPSKFHLGMEKVEENDILHSGATLDNRKKD